MEYRGYIHGIIKVDKGRNPLKCCGYVHNTIKDDKINNPMKYRGYVHGIIRIDKVNSIKHRLGAQKARTFHIRDWSDPESSQGAQTIRNNPMKYRGYVHGIIRVGKVFGGDNEEEGTKPIE